MREIERTLEQIPADTARPTRADIAKFATGSLLLRGNRSCRRVYVQPAWMTGVHARAIAVGEESVESAREIVRDFDLEHAQSEGSE